MRVIVTGVLFNSTSQEWTLSSTPIYTLPDAHPSTYDELFSIPNITSTLSITHLHTLANETATPPLNWQFWTSTFSAFAPLLVDIFSVINETIYSFNVPEGVVWSIAFEPLPTTFLAPGAGKNSLGTSPKDGNGIIMLISPLWPNSLADGAVHAKAAEVVNGVNAKARENGMLKRFVYANYADWSQHQLESYGEQDLEFLKRTAGKYDPKGVFQKKVPGGFKLPPPQ